MKFDLDSFTWLSLVEMPDKWNHCGMATIDQVSAIYGDADSADPDFLAFQNELMSLLEAIDGAAIGEVDPEHLWTCVTDDLGTIEKIRDVGIFQSPDDENQLVLKLGSNLFKVTQKEDKLYCGLLSSNLKFEEVKDNDGKLSYVRVSVDFRKKGDKTIFSFTCLFQKDAQVTQGEILAMMENDEPIAPLFMACPVGAGGNYIDMRTLEVGEYAIASIELGKVHEEYGQSYTVGLRDGRKFDARGNLKTILSKQHEIFAALLAKGRSLTLAITSKVKLDETRTSIKASIWIREPQNDLAALPSAGVATMAALPAAKSTTPMKAVQKVLTAAVVGDDPYGDVPLF